jgi:exonuclease 3'-5' domain-containing protein 1
MPLTKHPNLQTLDNTALIPIPMASMIVDTADQVLKLVECIESTIQKPLIFIDLEGVDLSRHGAIGIMQILVLPSPVVHLVDIFTLQQQAFDTSVSDRASLRTILECKDYPKVFFDVRNDSDALYSHFQINLQGVIDLQLLEYASRPRQGRFLKGLAKCVSEDGGLDLASSQEWQTIKNAGLDLFAPRERG